MLTDQDFTPTRSTTTQIILWILSLFSTIAPGITTGYSALALPPLTNSNKLNHLSSSQGSWFASIASIGTPLGCLLSGPISDRYGRRGAMLWINVCSFIGWISISGAYRLTDGQYPVLLCGRFITGLALGLSYMPPVVYLAEISSAKFRGAFTTSSSSFFASGIILLYAIGYAFKDDWGSIAMVVSVLPCCSVISIIAFLPESPVWLVSKNRINEARKNLRVIYGYREYNQEIFDEIQTLIKHRDSSVNSDEDVSSNYRLLTFFKKMKNNFKQPTYYRPFWIVLTFFFFQQASGGFVLIFYAMDIIAATNVKTNPYLVILATAVVRLVGTIITSVASKYIDRRYLSVISGSLMVTTLLSLSVLIHYGIKEEFNWMKAFLLVGFFFAASLGFLSIPFGLAAEFFPAKMRGTMTGLLTSIAFIFNFVIVKVYPEMIAGMGTAGILTFYGIMSLIGTFFVALFVPKTKGKTLIEIEENFR